MAEKNKQDTIVYLFFTSTFLHKPVDCRRGKDEYGKRYGSILVYRDRIMAYFFRRKGEKNETTKESNNKDRL